jgi:hypothetical protein
LDTLVGEEGEVVADGLDVGELSATTEADTAMPENWPPAYAC